MKSVDGYYKTRAELVPEGIYNIISGKEANAKLKAFISCPMNEKDEAEVRKVQADALSNLNHIAHCLRKDVQFELLETYTKNDVPDGAGRVWFLGDSIRILDSADILIFAGDWEKSKGCRREKAIATEYGIPNFTDKDLLFCISRVLTLKIKI